MLEVLSRTIAYPLWDLKDGSMRLAEYRRLLASQWLPSHALEQQQLRALQEIVKYAYANCEYYARSWGEPPVVESFDDLRKLPILTKQAVRNSTAKLISREFSQGELVEAKTGGSTGTALRLFFDERCQERRNAAALRSDGWAGWRPGMLVAALWGTPPVPSTFKERVRNVLHDRLFFLDTMELNDRTMRRFADDLVRRRPGGLFGHAHSLYVFCRFLEQQRLTVPRPQAVIATSMMLLESERALIERVLGCPVTNRYGCEEVGLIACQCEQHRGLHVNAEHVYVELLRADGTPAAPGESGQVVVTDLVNRGMPLIRYAIEDMAVWSEAPCGCGRALPVLEKLVGRVADFLVKRDGSLVAGVSLVEKTLTAIEGIEQLQIVQTDIARFELNVVPGAGFGDASRAALDEVLHGVFGAEVNIEVHCMSALPQERNGKYRFAICHVSAPPALRSSGLSTT